MTPCRRTSFPSLDATSVPLVVFAHRRTSAPSWPGFGNPVSPIRDSPRTERVSPKFLGNLCYPFAMFQSDSGRTADARPLRRSSVAPGMQTAEAPTINGLSELNRTAFGLAVYASWSESPQYHAKRASGSWSGSTERDFHPQGSDERFQCC